MNRDEINRAIEANPRLRAAREKAIESVRKQGVIVTRAKRDVAGNAYTEIELVKHSRIHSGGSA